MTNQPTSSDNTLPYHLLNSLSDGIVAMDIDGNILFANQSSAALLGYSREALEGKNINILLPELEQQQLRNYQMLGVCYESAAMHFDGHALPVELTINVVEQVTPNIFTVIIHDNSERKKIELLKHDMASNINHKLRTPLTSIKGSLGVVINGLSGELPEKAKQLIDIAHNNSERLLTTIENILDPNMSEIEDLTYYFEAFELDQLVKEIMEESLPYCQLNNIELISSNQTQEIKLFADRGRLLQAMHHLIHHAVDHSKSQMTIEVIVEELYGRIRFTVRDHGRGLNFPLTELSRHADELGLNLSQAIIEKHQGELKYRGNTDEGNTFYFEIPLQS